jgi:hypothetical protein
MEMDVIMAEAIIPGLPLLNDGGADAFAKALAMTFGRK